MSFLPENYETPQTGGHYLKLAKGENKFRILSKPVIGWLDWKENKPMRFRMNAKPEKPVDANKPIRHFWAMYVWSYQNNAPMILEITQSTIQKSITDLNKDEDWGAPFAYDLKITKKGEDKNTEYTVTPSPKKPFDEALYQEVTKKPVNLEALFDNGDPFQVNGKVTEIEIDPFQ
jgi:hypothetical protein